MGQKTSLYEKHQAAGAKLIDFGGWDMPLHYGSQIEEHHIVRQSVGVFDVSHMTVIDVLGKDALAFLQYLVANDVAKLKEQGKALYTCMLNEQGGVVDDLIVYNLGPERYRLVVNAATREKDIQWVSQHAKNFSVVIQPRPDLGILAIQGPQAINQLAELFVPADYAKINALKLFSAVEMGDWMVARTGYTGEDGFEILIPQSDIEDFWDRLMAVGIKPCGLGARDTLRLEAGLNLYGTDMDENTSPLESNLSWTIAWEPAERDFVGRKALEQKRQQIQTKLVGVVLEQRGVLRNHQKIKLANGAQGEITSGSFSPTLQQAIGLARVPVDANGQCFVEIRGEAVPARLVKPQFVRHGKKVFE